MSHDNAFERGRHGTLDQVKANMEASLSVGPVFVSHGGVPFNEPHIEYWKKRALKAEADLAEANRKLRAEISRGAYHAD